MNRYLNIFFPISEKSFGRYLAFTPLLISYQYFSAFFRFGYPVMEKLNLFEIFRIYTYIKTYFCGIWQAVIGLFLHVAKPFLHVAGLFLHVAKPFLHVAKPFLHVAEPFLHVAEHFLHVAKPFLHVAELFLHVAERIFVERTKIKISQLNNNIMYNLNFKRNDS
jgi:hypothetical protein